MKTILITGGCGFIGSNFNYGPMQFPEKLIPLMILNAISGKPLPIYGDGSNIRDWLYVTDHCNALSLVLERGVAGETYNIGGHCERSNVDIIKMICGCLDHFFPDSPRRPHFALAAFVKDRPGHYWRYAVGLFQNRERAWLASSGDTGIRLEKDCRMVSE